MSGNFLTTPFFYNFIIPLMGTLFIIFVKFVSKRDSSIKKIGKEDFAVGFDLAVVSITYFAVETVKKISMVASEKSDINNVQQVANANLTSNGDLPLASSVPIEAVDPSLNVWVLLALVVSLWFASTFTRYLGWDENHELKFWMGVVIPNIYGTICLMLVVIFVGS